MGPPGTWLADDELRALGFVEVGRDVRMARTAQVLGAEHVSLGSHVRIDSFAVITAAPGQVVIGDHVHLGVGASLFGTAGIRIGHFASLSARATIYSTDDDYVDGHLSGPTVDARLRRVRAAEVALEAHALVGSGTVILPGVRVGRAAAVGALSLVKRDVEPGAVVAGVPARVIGTRDVERIDRLEAEARNDDE